MKKIMLIYKQHAFAQVKILFLMCYFQPFPYLRYEDTLNTMLIFLA